MRTVQKFLFTTSFDEDEPAAQPEPEVPPPPPPPTFGEAELEAARAEGYEAGRAAASAEAAAAAERERAGVLAVLAERVAGIGPEVAAAGEEAQRRAVALGLTIVRRMLPELTRRHGTEEVEGLLRETLRNLLGESRVVLRVSDAELDTVNERVAQIAGRAGYAGRVVLIADDELAPGDCRIEWADGGVERDAARLWREIERAAERVLGAPAVAAAAVPTAASTPPAHPTDTD